MQFQNKKKHSQTPLRLLKFVFKIFITAHCPEVERLGMYAMIVVDSVQSYSNDTRRRKHHLRSLGTGLQQKKKKKKIISQTYAKETKFVYFFAFQSTNASFDEPVHFETFKEKELIFHFRRSLLLCISIYQTCVTRLLNPALSAMRSKS